MTPAEKEAYMAGLQEHDPLPWTDQDRMELHRVLAHPSLQRALSRVLAETTEMAKRLAGIDMSKVPESNIRASAIQGHIFGFSSALDSLAGLAEIQETQEEDTSHA